MRLPLTFCVSRDTFGVVGRQAESEPGEFAKAVSREFRREQGDRRLSGRQIAKEIGKSEKYVRERLADVLSFTLNDVEAFARFCGYSPEEFVQRIERDLPAPEPINLAARRRVAPLTEDGLRDVARPRETEPGEDPETP